MKSTALIGHTGFVGGNLLARGEFSHLFNSSNFRQMRGQSFDEVWCAGVSAVKWWANKNPREDKAAIDALLEVLGTVTAGHMVLLSTVDVFASPIEVYEDSPTPVDGLHAYGAHRLAVEDFVRQRFASHTIVRLPGLFGDGLKKNIIYDLLHDNQLENIDSRSVFQFYGLDSLWRDINRARAARLPLVHFATEPVSVAEVARHGFGRQFARALDAPPVRYDMRTRHAQALGGVAPYMQRADEVLGGVKAFVERWRVGGAGR